MVSLRLSLERRLFYFLLNRDTLLCRRIGLIKTIRLGLLALPFCTRPTEREREEKWNKVYKWRIFITLNYLCFQFHFCFKWDSWLNNVLFLLTYYLLLALNKNWKINVWIMLLFLKTKVKKTMICITLRFHLEFSYSKLKMHASKSWNGVCKCALSLHFINNIILIQLKKSNNSNYNLSWSTISNDLKFDLFKI